MSLILDALQRGRARAVPRPRSTEAQTDAVLQTLGHGRQDAVSPRNRIRRFAGYAFLGALALAAIWGGVIWRTALYHARTGR